MSLSTAARIRLALVGACSLAGATVLPGCGSDTGGQPLDAAKEASVAADAVLSPDAGLDAAPNDVGVDTLIPIDAADAAVAVDAAITDASLDIAQTDSTVVDGAVAVDSRFDVGSVVDGASIDGGALPACASLVNPLYIMSGDTQVPVLKTLGKALRQGANPVTLVWYATGSCTIIDALYNGTPLKQIPSYIPSDATWDPNTGAVPSCALESAGHSVDVGIPIVFPASCTTATPPADLAAFKGPAQSMLFVVPHGASPEAISSAQAKLVFGTGSTANIAPWTDENFYFIRPPTKGVQVSLGALIGVPAANWHGQQINASNDVATDVATSTSPEKTIGILGSETFDSTTNRANLKALAFQATDQTNGGYLPDSTATAFDKRSVREGHYVAWAHVFYLTKVSPADGGVTLPVSSNAQLLIDILTNTANSGIPAGLDPVALVAQKGLVPLCAMSVTRAADGGPLSLFSPPDPCGCYYESKVGTAPASCVPCTTSGTCAGGAACHHGFCEADDGRTSLSDCTALPAAATHAQIINNTCAVGARFESDPIP
jgi:hypothetical protein